ncbi:hypothetical protein [Bradyrhizobium sp. 62]|uniref:hypothetical protein n=1 Tax=Bradyrhizobium sp. 62 TaxID=1043588 RepID=UPI001FF95FC0|nr:hypothetical protein [Bradyrhizobium sp. 62]MCK1368321.1 hypothetical protein [Bradyrhizobium sp. 62]
MTIIPHPNVAFADLAERLTTPADEVMVPRKLLMRLLDLYISSWDFDEDWYLATYPDIQAAVTDGKFASGWDHFKSVGYFEGRRGNRPVVDTDWYLETYPDIAKAILEGKVTSASEHFEAFGYAEGRLPSNPEIHTKWYARRYMSAPHPEAVKESDALQDFVRIGYRSLALPAPPR